MKKYQEQSVLFVEINEAEKYFLDRYLARGLLPNFAKLAKDRAFVVTKIPGFTDDGTPGSRAWRDIMPWVIWPSLYTGLAAKDHGVVAFGQDTAPLQGKCLWDVLDRHGISAGVFGSLQSYPPRNHGQMRFYVPDSLSDDAACFPPEVRPLQEFCVSAARNYSEDFLTHAIEGAKQLLQSPRCGVQAKTLAKLFLQVPREKWYGPQMEADRAFLHSALCVDAFKYLYAKHRPRFATVHMNHIAYSQHRYWRAAEPARFSDELSETDTRFFATAAARNAYEAKHADRIQRAFVYADEILGELLALAGDETLVVVTTALGQEPIDPVHEIHNPVVRLTNEIAFFDAAGLKNYRVYHQMNPDLTINFLEESEAAEAEKIVEAFYVDAGAPTLAGASAEPAPLFTVERIGRQLFCEFRMPVGLYGRTNGVTIRHRNRPSLAFPFGEHVSQHGTNDQSTAQHRDDGWLLIGGKGMKVEALRKEIAVTEVAPAILGLFGLPPEPWQQLNGAPFTVTPR